MRHRLKYLKNNFDNLCVYFFGNAYRIALRYHPSFANGEYAQEYILCCDSKTKHTRQWKEWGV